MKEQIHKYCQRLHLPVTAERWSAMAEYAATHNIPYSEFLFRLLEAEVAEKQERSIQTLIKLSKLPYRKTIDTFDFAAQPSVDERRIRELLTLSLMALYYLLGFRNNSKNKTRGLRFLLYMDLADQQRKEPRGH